MKVNETNKALYEAAFITGGEYASAIQEPSWKPSIDENQIEEWQGDNKGNYVPATPLGYRDYKESRLEGLKNILAQEEYVDLTDNRLHNLKREDEIIKQYDKINTDNGEFVVTGDDEDIFYVVNVENNKYYVEYIK